MAGDKKKTLMAWRAMAMIKIEYVTAFHKIQQIYYEINKQLYVTTN